MLYKTKMKTTRMTRNGENIPGMAFQVKKVTHHTMAISTFSGTRLLDN
jgi:hypothetical protein